MPTKEQTASNIKPELHARNKNRYRYNFDALCKSNPELSQYVVENEYNDASIDFSDPLAVKELNRAILKVNYKIEYWDIPENYLCPPIPGRADYVHNIADLLAASNKGKIPKGNSITCIDIGVGANCIYPIIGHSEYGWKFIGADTDNVALESAKKIVSMNNSLASNIECVLQKKSGDFFFGIISKTDKIACSFCNPPFHSSAREAKEATLKKLRKLSKSQSVKLTRNYGGQSTELWYPGGERRFIINMIRESKKFAETCLWFSSLVSNKSNLVKIEKALKDVEVKKIDIIPMGQGNKVSRVIAWTFVDMNLHPKWFNHY